MLVNFIGGETDRDVMNLSDEEVVQQVSSFLISLCLITFPFLKGTSRFVKNNIERRCISSKSCCSQAVVKGNTTIWDVSNIELIDLWNKSVFRGHGELVQSISNIERKVPGLFLAGNYRTGVAFGDCIEHGKLTADFVSRYVRQQNM